MTTDDPCEMKYCMDGMWASRVVDCMTSEMCEGTWVETTEGECCGGYCEGQMSMDGTSPCFFVVRYINMNIVFYTQMQYLVGLGRQLRNRFVKKLL